MKRRIDNITTRFQQQKGQQIMLQQQVREAEAAVAEIQSSIATEKETLRLLQLSSAATWDTAKGVVEALVTRALQAIFYDKDYKFVVKQEVKRASSSVTFAVADEGAELDLVDELGGGIADVVALVLRIAFLTLHRPRIRPFLVLDEPLKHLWSGYQPHAAKFLKQVCAELGITLLVVTHQKELAEFADQVFQMRKNGVECSLIEENDVRHLQRTENVS